MTYPILYNPGHTDFNNLGLGLMVDTISATVTEELNGKFELDLEYLADGPLTTSLINDAFIKVPTGDQVDQLFRIKSVGKKLKGILPIHAEHVSYIINDLPIKPRISVINADGAMALNAALINVIDKHPLTAYSDVMTTAALEWKLPDFQNIRNILGGVEGSILDRIGGEYQFDNYQIRLMKQRGRYSNTIIAYGRNLTDFEQDESILETYTSIYPVVIETEDDTQKIKVLPEYVIDGDYVDKYPNRRVTMVDFSEKFNENNTYSEAKLRKLAQTYVKANNVGVPKVTMKVSTVDLSAALDDSFNVKEVESLHLGDTVKVFFEPLGITSEAKVVGVAWNVLLERYDSYTLGAKKASFGQWVNNSVNDIKNIANSAQHSAIQAVTSANGKNTNYYGNSGDGFPKNPKKGDLYFQKDGDKMTIYQWDGSSWINVIDTSWQEDFEKELQDKLDEAKKELDEALEENGKALANLDDRLTENKEALEKNETKLSDLDKQLSDAQKAIDNVEASNDAVVKAVEQAQKDANEAVSKADNAVVSSLNAQTLANTAISNLTEYSKTTDANIVQLNNKISLTVSNAEYQADKTKIDVRLSNIELTQEGITSTVTAAKHLTTNMNLLFNSTWNDGFKGWTEYVGKDKILPPENDKPESHILRLSRDTNNYSTSQNKVKVKPAQKFVISYDIRVDNVSDTEKNMMYIRFFDEMETKRQDYRMQISDGIKQGLTANKWFRFNFIGMAPSYGHHFKILTGHGGGTVGTTMDFREIMVTQYIDEEVPEWSPSMYDLDTTNISQITQLSDNINLAVMQGDVINQINISKEEILIGGNKVHITGKTVIDNAIITTAMIKELDASVITTGTLAANLIVPTAGNMLMNSEFQSNTFFDGWVTTGSNPALFYDSAGKYTDAYGGQSYAAGINSIGNGSTTSQWRRLKQDVRGRANFSYSASTVAISGKNANNGRLQFALLFLDSSKQTISYVTSDPVTMDNKYHELKIENAVAPANTVYVRFEFQALGEVNAYVTRAMLNRGAKVLPYSASTGQVIVGSDMIVDGAVIAKHLAANSVTANAIAANSITAVKIAANAITADKILAGAITTKHLAAGSITATQLAAGAVNMGSATVTGTLDASKIKVINLDASELKAGTINAATVRIINLDASAISTGSLNASRIAAGSITADKLAANAIQVGLGQWNSTVRITPYQIAFYSGTKQTSYINDQGFNLIRDGVNIGHIGANSMKGDASVRGLDFDLEYGAQYMTWAHMDTSGASTYTTKLVWSNATRANINMKKGFSFSDNVYLNEGINMSGNTTKVKFNGTSFNGNNYPVIASTTGAAAVAFGSSILYLINDSKYFSVTRLQKFSALSGGLAIATGFNSDGTAKGWYNI